MRPFKSICVIKFSMAFTRYLLILFLFTLISCNPCSESDDSGDSIEKVFFSAKSSNSESNLIFEFDGVFNFINPISENAELYSGPDKSYLVFLSRSENGDDTLKTYSLENSEINSVLVSFDLFQVMEPKMIYGKEEIVFHNGQGQVFISDLNGNLQQISADLLLNSSPVVSKNGNRIAFFENNSNPLLSIRDHAGIVIFNIDLQSEPITNPTINLDLTAFVGHSNDKQEIFVYSDNNLLIQQELINLNINDLVVINSQHLLLISSEGDLWTLNNRTEFKRSLDLENSSRIVFVDYNEESQKIIYGVNNSLRNSTELYVSDVEINDQGIQILNSDLISNKISKAFWLINE